MFKFNATIVNLHNIAAWPALLIVTDTLLTSRTTHAIIIYANFDAKDLNVLFHETRNLQKTDTMTNSA